MKNVKINYEQGAAEFAERLLSVRLADEGLARLAGALDGATVNVSVRLKKGWLYLAVDDPARFEIYETSLRRAANGDLYAYLHEVRAAAGQSGQGYGARAFLRQVKAAGALGVKRFELFAAGDPADTANNGYYTWARFGFNAPLSERERKALPPKFKPARNLNNLIRLGGWRWWIENGSFRSMVFELGEGSAMMQLFNEYLKQRGITED